MASAANDSAVHRPTLSDLGREVQLELILPCFQQPCKSILDQNTYHYWMLVIVDGTSRQTWKTCGRSRRLRSLVRRPRSSGCVFSFSRFAQSIPDSQSLRTTSDAKCRRRWWPETSTGARVSFGRRSTRPHSRIISLSNRRSTSRWWWLSNAWQRWVWLRRGGLSRRC